MYTRKDYMDKKCTHSQYYAQFVNETTLSRVERIIGKQNILASKCEHFNDCKTLSVWDLAGQGLVSSAKFRQYGDGLTLCGLVCVAKEAARQIREAGQ